MDSYTRTNTFEFTDFSHSQFMARKAENWRRIAKLTFLDIHIGAVHENAYKQANIFCAKKAYFSLL